MPIDELPKSDRIEDRRGGLSGIPGGRGLWIGTIVGYADIRTAETTLNTLNGHSGDQLFGLKVFCREPH
jgi:hypothetical protein